MGIIIGSSLITGCCNRKMAKNLSRIPVLLLFLILNITGCDKVEQKLEESNVETPRIDSDGNKLIVKKEGIASTFINGDVKQAPLIPIKTNNQQIEGENSVKSKVTILLLSDVEWLPEGSGVLLTTNKGYINGYSQSMMDILGDGKKGECYTIESESNKMVTIHKNKYPDLDSLKNETEDLIAEQIVCN